MLGIERLVRIRWDDPANPRRKRNSSRSSTPAEVVDQHKALEFESILTNDVGIGLYQILVAITTGMISASATFISIHLIFNADIFDHRCLIPECDEPGSADFWANHLRFTVPPRDDRNNWCYRYRSAASNSYDMCLPELFDNTSKVTCDRIVTSGHQFSIASHFNLLCRQNYKLRERMEQLADLSATFRIMGAAMSGFGGDIYGRINTMTIFSVFGALATVLQALPDTMLIFEPYCALFMLASMVSSGMVGNGVVYTIEWVSTKKRVLITIIFYTVQTIASHTYVALVSWYFADNFQGNRLALAFPCLLPLIIAIPFGESPLLYKARCSYSRAIKSLTTACYVNGRRLEKCVLERRFELAWTQKGQIERAEEEKPNPNIFQLLRVQRLFFRLVFLTVVWLLAFVAHAATDGNQHLHMFGDKYWSYWIVGMSDMLGVVFYAMAMNFIGRKRTIGIAMLLYGFLLIVSMQFPKDGYYRMLYFASKALISTAVMGLHTYTAELWPTSARATAFGIALMGGRIAFFVAQSSFFKNEALYRPHAASAFVCAIIIFLALPETMLSEHLPESINDALNIGKIPAEGAQPQNNEQNDQQNIPLNHQPNIQRNNRRSVRQSADRHVHFV